MPQSNAAVPGGGWKSKNPGKPGSPVKVAEKSPKHQVRSFIEFRLIVSVGTKDVPKVGGQRNGRQEVVGSKL